MKQRGFSLVELMVAMFISLLLISSIFAVLMSTKKSSWLTDAISHNQEAGRFSMDFLTRHIRLSGFSQGLAQTPTAIIKPPCNTSFCSVNDAPESDILAISFFAPDGYRDCAGNEVVEGDLVITSFSVVDKTLRCKVSLDAGETIAADAPLLDGVESMQFLVGTKKGIFSVDGNFKSEGATMVRVALLVSSPEVKNGGGPAVQEKLQGYVLLDKDVGTFNDNRLRNVFSTTIKLENNL